MNSVQILELINTNPVCSLATVDGGQPRVRGMMMYKADAKGLIFHTGSTKALSRQIQANPKAEACFLDTKAGTQIRVAGVIEILNDMALKKEIAEARPFMKPWIEQKGWDFLVVFRIMKCKAAVWMMATNLELTTYQEL